jgi:hypothetical protein
MKNMDSLEAMQAELERGRKRFKIFAVVFVVAVLGTGAFLGAGHEFYNTDGGRVDGSLVGTGIALLVAAVGLIAVRSFTVGRKARALDEAFKSGVVAAELQNALEDVDYQPRESYTKDYVRRLGIFRHFDSARGNDYLQAKFRGRQFSRCDQTLFIKEEYQEKDSDGNTRIRDRDVEVFEGSITTLELPSPFLARLLVIPDFIRHAVPIPERGDSSKQMAIFGSGNGTGKALDSLKFKREYHVIGNSNEMLTQSRIECLRRLDESAINPFVVLFEGSKLHLIVQNENFFEIDTGKKAASMADQRNRVVEQVKKLTDRLDLLLEME